MDAQHHSLRRTSPKGQPFIGTCTLCGEQNLSIGAALQYCENPRGVSQEDAVIEAVVGPGTEPDPNMPTDGYSDAELTLLETVDLFLNGDGSGIGGRDLIRKLAAELTRLQQANAALVEALKPFATALDKCPDYYNLDQKFGHAINSVSTQDFEDAAAALAQQ